MGSGKRPPLARDEEAAEMAASIDHDFAEFAEFAEFANGPSRWTTALLDVADRSV